MKNRKIRKSGFWQRMMAVLLAAVLVFGMVWDDAPTSVLAQESVSENTPVDGETEQEEETETEPSGEDTKPAEGTDADEQEKTETTEPAEETAPEGQESDEEEEKETESVSENDAPTEIVAAPQSVMMAAAVAQADDTIIGGSEEDEWTLTADGRLTITSNRGMNLWFSDKKSFYQETQYQYKDLVTSAEIQSGVTYIIRQAFMNCSKLVSIDIPESVESIGDDAFYYCLGLESIEIPGNVRSIGDNVFSGCNSLESINIPESVESIGNGTFSPCKSLKSINIPEKVTSIRDNVFSGCNSLESINIPESVESIGDYAFSSCWNLASIRIPEKVTSIGDYAFQECSSLDEIIVERQTPPTLGSDVFVGCPSATAGVQGIHVPSGTAQAYKDAWTEWADYIVESTEPTDKGWTLEDGKLTIKTNEGMTDWIKNGRKDNENVVTSVEIKDGVESIGEGAFNLCRSLEEIKIPDSVKSIGKKAFYFCDSLKKIEIPYGVKSIEENTFESCTGLTGIKIPNSVKKIDGSAFVSCESLTEITIPESVTEIGSGVFGNCRKLTKVIMESKNPPTLDIDVFGNCPGITGTKSIYVPAGALEAYQGTEGKEKGWEPYKDNITESTPPAAEHNNHNNVEFTAWTQTNSLPTTAGNYYLTENVTLTDTWNVPYGTTTLCLNGKTISAPGADSVIRIGGGTLELYDCQGAGNITGGQCGVNVVGSLCTFQMYGGKISGNSSSSYGGGVKVIGGGTFEMHGGEISGNSANSATGSGGGVYGKDTSTFRMYGGKISGNSASMGGGVYGEGTTIFRMYGGEISGNNATQSGGGVWMLDDRYTLGVGRDAVISGNTCNGKVNNVYLRNGQKIDVAEPLSGSASIGVTTETPPTEGNPVKITPFNETDYSKYFSSDDPAYEIVNVDDAVYLAVKSQPHTHVLTPVEAKDATCTEDGNEAYYVCGGNDGCGMWFSDAEGTQAITDHNSVVISKTGHSYDTSTWGYQTAEGHAHQCVNCDAHDEVEAHTPGAAATETTPQTCTVCGYVIAAAIGHTCSPQPVAKKEATCTTAGKQAYYHCEGCGKDYEDAEGTTLIADISAWGNIAALGHDWGEWKVTKKATATKPGEKERTCKRCEAKETEPIPATGGGSGGGGNQGGGSGGDQGGGSDGDNQGGDSQSGGDNGGGGNTGGGGQGDGSDGGSSGNNGRAGDNQDGSSDGGSGNGGTGAAKPRPGKPGASGTGQPKVKQEKKGNIQKEVRVEGEATLDAAVATTLTELADIVLTEAERQQAAGGTSIRIVLDVKDASAGVSAADKKVVAAALGGTLAKGYTLGQYLDINLYKVVGGSRSAVTQTGRKITVTIQVPDSLKNTDGTKTRTFVVIRVHDGKAELLTDLDNKEDTITIETDRFSTYDIVYQDTAGKNGGAVRVSVRNESDKKPGGGLDDEPDTGERTPLELCATLSMIAGFTYLFLYFADRRRGMTEEMKKELVSRLTGWGKRGGRIRRYLALAAIFVLLVYYHSIGKKTCVEWKESYGE